MWHRPANQTSWSRPLLGYGPQTAREEQRFLCGSCRYIISWTVTNTYCLTTYRRWMVEFSALPVSGVVCLCSWTSLLSPLCPISNLQSPFTNYTVCKSLYIYSLAKRRIWHTRIHNGAKDISRRSCVMLRMRDAVTPFYHRAVIVYEAQRFSCATGNSSFHTCFCVFLSIHTDIKVLCSGQNVTFQLGLQIAQQRYMFNVGIQQQFPWKWFIKILHFDTRLPSCFRFLAQLGTSP